MNTRSIPAIVEAAIARHKTRGHELAPVEADTPRCACGEHAALACVCGGAVHVEPAPGRIYCASRTIGWNPLS